MPLEAVAEVVAAAGIGGRRLRQALTQLATTPTTLDDLIREHAVPRRTIEQLLRAAGRRAHRTRRHPAPAGRVPGPVRRPAAEAARRR
ncbi:hypothetical protein GCM10027610_087710 [Dactylosporangium cerinum]